MRFFHFQLSELVERVLNEDKLCITLGGDHAIGIGTISGFTRAFKNQQTCLLWIDAHADINTVDTSDSGNMHGMPVSFNLKQLTRRNAKDLKWLQPRLAPHRMAFIGLRCVDPEERKTLNELKIPAFSMREVDQLGIREVKNYSWRSNQRYGQSMSPIFTNNGDRDLDRHLKMIAYPDLDRSFAIGDL